MRNVLVFGLGQEHYAVELRWVREVISLGPLTCVPTAPPAIAGAVSHLGSVLPVLAPAEVVVAAGGRPVRPGDAAVVLEADRVRAALAVDRVETVTTLDEGADGVLVDAEGRRVPLLDTPEMLRRVRAQTSDAAQAAEAALLDWTPRP